MALNLMFGNPIVKAINRAARIVTLKHPWSIDAVVYRKERIAKPNQTERTIGGARILGGIDDESDYEITLQGACKIKFTGVLEPSELAGDGLAFTEQEITAMIEPIIEDEFEIKKYDRLYLILPNIKIGYQIKAIVSPENLPNGQSKLYALQPLEQTENWDIEKI